MENLLLFWMSKPVSTCCQDTLEDKTSFSHIRVTVSPSKMISGVMENFVSSGNPKQKISGSQSKYMELMLLSECHHHWGSREVFVVMNEATRLPHSTPGQLGSEAPE